MIKTLPNYANILYRWFYRVTLYTVLQTKHSFKFFRVFGVFYTFTTTDCKSNDIRLFVIIFQCYSLSTHKPYYKQNVLVRFSYFRGFSNVSAENTWFRAIFQAFWERFGEIKASKIKWFKIYIGVYHMFTFVYLVYWGRSLQFIYIGLL